VNEAECGPGFVPRVFEHAIRVVPEDIDQMGHVNNVVYLRYAQDAAVAHWRAAAPPEHRDALMWVVRRHEIDYLKPALADDHLLARTWVGQASGATFERFVEIARPADAGVLARVRTVWVALDATTRRPRRIPEALRACFGDDPARHADKG
jgi:acyl-CoA thioester hydrolase